MVRRTWWAAVAALVVVTASGAAAQAPGSGPVVEADPVRCWWRSDRASVKMGEPFEAVLTCAALETASTTVVVDRSRLDPTVMAAPPFDVLGGTTAEDATTAARRFFQYTYQLRLLNDTAFGQDVALAGLTLTYRIDTRTSEGTTSQGRDQTYVLPPLVLRVLSLVPGGARDIRDASGLTFADLEARRFRARALGILGWVLYALAAAVVALAVVRAYSALGVPAKARTSLVSGRAVLRRARRELGEVTRARQAAGWSDALIARAAAALRIVGSYAIGEEATQRTGLAAQAADGQLALSQGLVRRRHALVSSALTPADLDRTAETDAAVGRLRDGLGAATAARYGRAGVDDGAVDGAVAAAEELAGALAWRHSWPMVQWAKFMRRIAAWQGTA
ncbi:MAG: hypothetical protein AB7U83_13810 [Vicinamibacterales bacterium]